MPIEFRKSERTRKHHDKKAQGKKRRATLRHLRQLIMKRDKEIQEHGRSDIKIETHGYSLRQIWTPYCD